MIGHLGQTEVADHDLGVLVRTVVQQVLRLQTDKTMDVNDISLKNTNIRRSSSLLLSGLCGRCCSDAGRKRPPGPV